MPGKRADRIALRTLTQQRQEQQRTQPTSTPETSAAGAREQQGLTVQFNPHAAEPDSWLGGQPLSPAYVAPQKAGHTLPPRLTPAQVGREVERLLAPLPHVPGNSQGPLTHAEEEGFDLMHVLLERLAGRVDLADGGDTLRTLISQIPDAGTACGAAAHNIRTAARS